MPVYKTPKADLRRQYPLVVQIGILLSLVVLIGAFTISFRATSDFIAVDTEQEIIQVEEIEQTRQELPPPPPPPAPPPPVEVPDDEIVEQEVIDMSLDLDLTAAPPAPPPPSPPAPAAAPPPPPPPPPPEPEIFEVVEQMPELIGGLEGLQRSIRYPEMARRAGIEGRVFLSFVVDEQGRVIDPVVTRGIGGGADEAALEAIRRARFRPGMQRGRAVKVRFSLPITFRLN
ncbi:energy transducer TonB [soil metagenome]